MNFRPNPEQEYAIQRVDQSMALTAGAGAGKTRVLVQRFLQLLDRTQVAMDQIAAITFTKKAAQEMKERLFQELSKRARESNSLEKQLQTRKLLEQLPGANISTIHSFCSQLLYSYPLEAGVDPRFTVLVDLDTHELLSEAAHEALIGQLREPGEDPWLRYLLMSCGPADLQKTLMQLHNSLHSRGVRAAELEQVMANHLTENEGRQPLAQLLAAGPLATEKGWLAEWESHSLADRLTWLEDWASGRQEEAASSDCSAPGQDTGLADLADQLLCQGVQTVFKLYGRMEELYQAKKAARRGLDFADLEEKARLLLETHPELTQNMRQKYRYLLVDEYQDTNYGQFRLVSLLAGRPLQDRLFIVGDPKQSIYRFRGAVVQLFDRTKQMIVDELGKEKADRFLSINYRTRAPIIDFVNHLTPKLMQGERYDAMTAHREVKDPGAHVELLLAESSSGRSMGREQEAELLARRIAQMVRSQEALVYPSDEAPRPVEYQDIAILFRAMTHVDLFEDALKRYGIPYHIVGGRGFYETQEVTDMIALLKAVARENDLFSLWAWLRSPLVGLQDQSILAVAQAAKQFDGDWGRALTQDLLPVGEQAKFNRAMGLLSLWRALRSRISIADLMETILNDTSWPAYLACVDNGEQMLANLHKLIQVARQLTGRDNYSLDQFLTRLDELVNVADKETEAALHEEGGNAVRIMTIHKSKGLEFNVVFVADMSRAMTEPNALICWHPEHGAALNFPGLKSSSILGRIREADRFEEDAESTRVLYVAMTRAKDYLVLSGCYTKGGTWYRGAQSWMRQVCEQIDLSLTALQPLHAIAGTGILVKVTGQVDMELSHPIDRMAVLNDDMLWGGGDAGPVSDGEDLWQQIMDRVKPLPVTPRPAVTLAVSPLLLYEHCPRAYFFHYRHRLKDALWSSPNLELTDRAEEDEAEQDMDEEGQAVIQSTTIDPAKFGSLIHAVCEQLSEPDQLPPLLQKLLPRFGFDPNDQQVVNEANAILAAYVRSDSFAELNGAQWQAELPFQAELVDGLVLQGIIDRLKEDEEGLTIVDFKTNRVEHGVEYLVKRYQLQLQIYALAAQRLYGKPVKRVLLYFLRSQEAREVDCSPAALQQVQEKLKAMALALEQGYRLEDFPACPPSQCGLCGYRALCQMC